MLNRKSAWWGWESLNTVEQPTVTEAPSSATLDALLWAHRSMSFYAQVLREFIKDCDNKAPPKEDMTHYFRDAWTRHLAAHSTWLRGMLFEVILQGLPHRSQFLEAASGKGSSRLNEVELFDRLRAYVCAIDACNGALEKTFAQKGIGK